MNQKLYEGVIEAIRWMIGKVPDRPELRPILSRLIEGEKKERRVPQDTKSAITEPNQ
jgi:hypothetical protein